MQSDKIRIGILGTASIAERFIIPALKELHEYFELVGVASRNKLKADAFAKKNQVVGFSSYEQLLNDKSLQAVYIPLPNSLHYEWVKLSLSLGLHVLVEKSLACNLKEAEELNTLARSKNLALIENFQFRFHYQLSKIKELVQNGAVGELRCVRSSFGFPPFKDEENIRYKKDLGGGALLDAGAYPLKIAQQFLGTDIYIASSSLSYNEKKCVDVWGGAFLKQNTGSLFAEIAFGFDNFYQCNLELWGRNGIIKADRIFTSPPGHIPSVRLITSNGDQEVSIEADDHFKNMLLYFHRQCCVGDNLETEYFENINQARLIEELLTLS